MIVFLPAPVASLSASWKRPGVRGLVDGHEALAKAGAPGSLRCDLGEPDSDLRRFDLAEEQGQPVRIRIAPVLKQTPRLRGDPKSDQDRSPPR